MMETPDFWGPVNLGNPQEMTILDLAEMIICKTRSRSIIQYKDLPIDDPVKRKPDITLAIQKLNWKPEVSIEEGLDKTIEYFRKKY